MIDVHRLLPSEHDAWCRMRMTLWPELRADECVREKDEILAYEIAEWGISFRKALQ